MPPRRDTGIRNACSKNPEVDATEIEAEPAATARPTPTFPGALMRTGWSVPVWAWLAATVGAVVVIGPGWRPGSLLNFDLVLVPHPAIPDGMWGLGTELPRRVPLWAFLGWLSAFVGGEIVGKVFVTACIVAAFAGTYRLVARPALAAVGAATLYGFGPFLLTRVAAGHWHVVLAMAILPWAFDDLVTPNRSLRRVLWWSAALGVASIYGGALAGAVLLAGLAVDRGRRAAPILGLYLVGQLPWLVPMVVVQVTAAKSSMAVANAFSPNVDGLEGVTSALAGHGFWSGIVQIGRHQDLLAAVLGVAVLGLAVVGTDRLPRRWRLPMVLLAGASFLFSISAGLAGLADPIAAFSETVFGAPFRETQRYLTLYLLWAAVAAGFGVVKIAGRLRRPLSTAVLALPLVFGVVLALPGMWGLNGQFGTTTQFPPEWSAARDAVRAEPGTVVALPFYEYFTLDLADNRLVLNTVSLYFGGDVIWASDPRITAQPAQERVDPRETRTADLVAKAKRGEPISGDLAALGVRWIALQHDVDWLRYTAMATDPGLERVVAGDSLDLYRVRGWQGPVHTADGATVPSTDVASPLMRVDASGPAVLDRPFQTGWLRGFEAAHATDDGLIALPAGSGPVWFWPASVVLVADAVTVGALGVSAVRVGRERRRRRADPAGTRP